MARSSNPTTGTAYPRSFLVIAVGVTIALLYFGREIFIPVALAFVLSFLLTPLVSWFQKLRIGRVPAVLIVMALCLAMMWSPAKFSSLHIVAPVLLLIVSVILWQRHDRSAIGATGI